jgi:hypothetical protein
MLPLKRDKRFHQGTYRPQNQDKFIGTTAIFRSGLELKFFRFCDRNPNIVKWGSECVILDYIGFDNKNHKYHVDNYVVIKENNNLVKYLIEIKPKKYTKKPVKRNQKESNFLYESLEWEKNSRKWKTAEEYCKKHSMKFLILTEEHLN